MRIYYRLAYAATFFLCSSPSIATSLGENPQLDEAFASARSIILGSRSNDRAAFEALQNVLSQDPEFAPALTEVARLYLRSSSMASNGPVDQFPAGAQQQAVQYLDMALALEPGYAESYVLYGYIAPSLRRPTLGLILLDEAERLGSDNLWIHVNRGKVLEVLDNREKASESYKIVAIDANRNEPGYVTALDGLTRIAKDFQEASSYYEQILATGQTDAFGHGNYARFLLVHGRFDDAITQSRSALALSSYPLARNTLALALLANAADQTAFSAATSEVKTLGFTLNDLYFDAIGWPNLSTAVIGMIDNGVDPDRQDAEGEAAIHFAIRNDDIDLVRALLERQANPNLPGLSDNSPLHSAAAAGRDEIVRMLLEAGATPHATNSFDQSPLDLALRYEHESTSRMLIASGAAESANKWAGLVAGIEERETVAMDRGMAYLYNENPKQFDILIALQSAVVDDPVPVLQLASQYRRVFTMLCGHSPLSGAGNAEASLNARRRTIEAIGSTKSSWQQVPEVVRDCYSSVERAASTPNPYRDSDTPSADERRDMLDEAADLIQNSEGTGIRLSQAKTLLREIRKSEPSNAQVELLQARIDFQEAQLQSGPNAGSYDSGNLDRLILKLENVLRLDPGNAEAQALYGHVLQHKSQFGLARLLLVLATSNESPNAWAHIYLAGLLSVTGQSDRALEHIELAGQIEQGQNARVNSVLTHANVLRAIEDLSGARQVLDIAAAAEPESALVRRDLILLLLHEIGDYAAAVESSRQLNNLGGNMEDHRVLAQALFANTASLITRNGIDDDVVRSLKNAARQAGTLEDAFGRAVRHSSTAHAARLLYEAGVDPDSRDERGNNSLVYAVADGQVEVVRQLISYGADVNAKIENGLVPLHVAIITRNQESAQLLIAVGASINFKYPDGTTIIDGARTEGMEELTVQLEQVDEGRFPDWDTFLRGVRHGQPEHVKRAMGLTAIADVQGAIQTGLAQWPLSVIKTAASENNLGSICGSYKADDAAIEVEQLSSSMDAVTKARDFQIALGLVPVPSYLNRCIGLLSSRLAASNRRN